MAQTESRKADRRRWRHEIIGHLAEFPRQYAALESAMGAFGGNFDLRRFKSAFETTDDLELYNQVQAVERAVGRVQNFVAELAISGVKLAQMAHTSDAGRGSPAVRAFETLRDEKVIDGTLCRRLVRAQSARTMIEHGYLQAAAGDVHRATELVHDSARDFIAVYRVWVERYLDDGDSNIGAGRGSSQTS